MDSEALLEPSYTTALLISIVVHLIQQSQNCLTFYWSDLIVFFNLVQRTSTLIRSELFLIGKITICITWLTCYNTLQDCRIFSYSWRAQYALVTSAADAPMWKTYVAKILLLVHNFNANIYKLEAATALRFHSAQNPNTSKHTSTCISLFLSIKPQFTLSISASSSAL